MFTAVLNRARRLFSISTVLCLVFARMTPPQLYCGLGLVEPYSEFKNRSYLLQMQYTYTHTSIYDFYQIAWNVAALAAVVISVFPIN